MPVPQRKFHVPSILVGIALVAACSAGDETRRGVALTDCRLPRLPSIAQCVSVEVPERRERGPEPPSADSGRRIRIHAAVLPANTLTPSPDPLFILAGGPGQAASSLAPLAAALERVRRTRDIVLVDQRGTGRSSPLACRSLGQEQPLQIDGPEQVRRIGECRREIESGGVDLTRYTTDAFVADLEDVRRALGYRQLNLWGGSYGTRVAQEYLRRHPERVRSVVLDGVAPPAMRIPLDIWPTRDAMLTGALAACATRADCARALPEIERRLDDIRSALPGPKTVALRDPATGETTRVEVSWEMVVGALHALTYAAESAALVPPLVARAAEGDYAPLLAGLSWVTGRITEEVSWPLHYAVVCSEDAPRVEPGEAARLLGRSRSDQLVRLNLEVCRQWPRAPVPGVDTTPVASDRPVLLLSGALDPVTPPGNAEVVARSLPNSRHVVAAGLGHIVTPFGCVPDLVGAFVERAGFDTLPQACIAFLAAMRRPPPFVSPLGAEGRVAPTDAPRAPSGPRT